MNLGGLESLGKETADSLLVFGPIGVGYEQAAKNRPFHHGSLSAWSAGVGIEGGVVLLVPFGA